MIKRCKLCGRKLDEGSNCVNEKCPKCTLDKILQAAEDEKGKAGESSTAENN